MDLITFIIGLLTGGLNDLIGGIGTIVGLIGNTPLALTTANPVVEAAWVTMTGVADAFLGLYVVVKAIQMMHGEATGSVHMPIGQFIPRVILTVILIHASAILGNILLDLTNALCGLVRVNVQDFIRQVNGGQLFNLKQTVGLSLVLTLVFSISLIRVILQALKRVVFFNVLFVLSGPAFLMSLDAQTAPWFSFWARTYLTTILTQFVQFLTFGLGFSFLIGTRQTGVAGYLLAIAMLNLTAEVPTLLSRFASSPGANVAGIGSVVRGAVTAAALLA